MSKASTTQRIIGGIGNAIFQPLGAAVSGTAKGVGHAVQGANAGLNGVAGFLGDKVLRPTGNLAGKGAKKAFLKKVDPSLANGYTGYQASALTNHVTGWGALGVAGVVGVASGAGKPLGIDSRIGFEGIETRASKAGQASYGGKPGIFDADGVGTPTQAPTLGASGDLVFGLHNGRRG